MEEVKMNHPWLKGIAEWTNGDTAFVSVPFTWLLRRAYSVCARYKAEGYKVRAGGPAVDLIAHYPALAHAGVQTIAEIDGSVPALKRHNPDATFTSRGCIRNCSFCAVPKIEGDLVELDDWDPAPVVCDNNLLATSPKHFESVIDRLTGMRFVDFNQGLDARLLRPWHLEGLRSLRKPMIRFAWDSMATESQVMDAINAAVSAGLPKRLIRVYMLFGYEDSPEDALYRCETLWGMGILMNVQRYEPLDCLVRHSYVSPRWTDYELRRFGHYWSRLTLGGTRQIPYAEFHGHERKRVRV